ncbi:MAG TPA: hypothetical protein VE779_00250 [Candidatus Angelobacter sp.]|nr:hypothetical protein [Candidatus Angelobacter sp.]
MSLGLLFTCIASVVSRAWASLVARSTSSFEGKKFSLSVVSTSAGPYLVTARSEVPVDPNSPAASAIEWSRNRLSCGPAVQELASAAARCNAVVGASVISGAKGENQYLLCVVPAARIPRVSRRS